MEVLGLRLHLQVGMTTAQQLDGAVGRQRGIELAYDEGAMDRKKGKLQTWFAGRVVWDEGRAHERGRDVGCRSGGATRSFQEAVVEGTAG